MTDLGRSMLLNHKEDVVFWVISVHGKLQYCGKGEFQGLKKIFSENILSEISGKCLNVFLKINDINFLSYIRKSVQP